MELSFSKDGLLPVVAVDRLTGEVRMHALANREAHENTLKNGRATFFSRSRNELWEKGKTSGNTMRVSRVLVDCDGDALLYEVDPRGPSCHTGAESCFFRDADGAPAERSPALLALDCVLQARKKSTAKESYAKSLYDGGPTKIGAKLREEADELARALASEPDDCVKNEAADVLFHVMVALRSRGMSMRDALSVLAARAGHGGHEEKKNRLKSGP